ncbi:MAG TPA: Si-specific NAD(P)(+) transhydrogenase [Candidatus Acidoferrales bacterium]|nr:Si-specific NAD(P)(+) transhydrogenase [Candidatus Acidoferrales bacterium]
MAVSEFDLIVIGSGPSGQKSAVAAAKLGKRVAVVDRNQMIGGVCVHTGTIPSKTLREAILHLKAFTDGSPSNNGNSDTNISVQDLAFRVQSIISRETTVIRAQLKRNRIAVIEGAARFADPHTLHVESPSQMVTVRGEHIVIACGTRPAHSAEIVCDGKRVIDTDQLPVMRGVPREVIVVGAGVVGIEYASFMAALGTEVTLIDQRPVILDFVDREIVDALCYHLRQAGMTFRLGEKVMRVGIDEQRDRVFAELESGKRVQADMLLYAVGRQANGDQLNLQAAGLQSDARGRLRVNRSLQTDVPHIYAVGDVIGFPALASTSMEQGRLASCHMFGVPFVHMTELFPYGIYTIPEISMVGQTEEQLTMKKVPYEVGIAKYAELAKSMMLGDESGMLKLLFERNTHELLGVHVIGERATEIIHIGQAVLSYGGKIDYFRDAVFNYPTLAEAYKVAALDGLNKL